MNKNNSNVRDAYYTNEGFEELLVNFVRIKSTYDCYGIFFQSCLSLHKYIKASCRSQRIVDFADTSSTFFFSRPIFISMANLSTSGSGLIFRRQSYATNSITFDLALLLASGNHNSSICLDTSCGVILVDRTWLIKKYLAQKISTILVSLKVSGISASKYKSREFTFTTLYILGINYDKIKVYICVKCKLYLVEGLKANILISNNILYTKDFSINLIGTSAHI